MMTKLVGTRALLLASFSLATMACGSDDSDGSTGTSSQPVGNVEICSWWTSGDEVAALDALITVHVAKYPQTTVTNLAEELADQARPRLEQRMAEGTPPYTFQANAGRDLLKWALFNGTDDADAK